MAKFAKLLGILIKKWRQYNTSSYYYLDESTSNDDAIFFGGNITQSDLTFSRRGTDPNHQYYDDLLINIGATLDPATWLTDRSS